MVSFIVFVFQVTMKACGLFFLIEHVFEYFYVYLQVISVYQQAGNKPSLKQTTSGFPRPCFVSVQEEELSLT